MPLTITIELPDNLEAALKTQANAHGVSEAGYVRSILAGTLAEAESTSSAPFKTGRGSFAKYGAAPSAEEIAANRADMFQHFADDF